MKSKLEIKTSSEPAILTMTITPDMIPIMKSDFNLEIEMLQGKQRKLKDGRTKFRIEIRDMQKAEAIKEFMLKWISDSHNSCQN